MRDLLPDDRPREKLRRHGAAALGDNELVALVLGNGSRRGDALSVANALLAAPILAAYIVWLSQVSLRKAAILYIPAVFCLFGIVQLVYYGILDAKRQHPLQTMMIFDLGGISHFSKENQFPVDWSESESAMLLDRCYQPTQWDIYWRLEPCDFVMRKVEREKGLFGTSAISKAWVAAILHHPIAYLRHRSAFMWNFLA